MLVELRFPVPDWWIAARAPQQERADAWNVVTEQALVRQPQLLDAALQALKPQRPGTVDLYFVGFAPYASQDVFRKDLFAARTAVGERFDVEGRTVELLSNPATVLDTPIATVSNLRRALLRSAHASIVTRTWSCCSSPATAARTIGLPSSSFRCASTRSLPGSSRRCSTKQASAGVSS